MIRAIGIDPGTVSFDICGLEGDRLFMDHSIPSAEIAASPERLIQLLESAGPVDLIVGPSGYGLPWVKAADMTAGQMKLLILNENRDHGRNTIVGGMSKMILLLKESRLPIYFAPGLIHLSTIPAHRKVNKIDMGTADKLCALALGIWDQSRQLQIGFNETSFIYVELGGAFTAVMVVDKGRVVDGLGGTSGCLGYLSMGAMDGELAYLMGNFHKEVLCTGGVAYIAGQPDMKPEQFVTQTQANSRFSTAWDAFIEGLAKCVAAEVSVVPSPREILISGRLCRMKAVVRKVSDRLAAFAPVRKVKGFAEKVKESAQGAAMIAEGLAGGVYTPLIKTMELDKASGTALDHLYFKGTETFRNKYLKG